MSKNPMVQLMLSDFRKRNEFLNPKDGYDSSKQFQAEENEAFEYFITYCILNAEGLIRGDFAECITGAGEEGIDAIAILVNGELATSIEDIKAHKGKLSVKYVFIQAKNTESWNSGDVKKFRDATREFFDQTSDIGSDDWTRECREIHQFILKNRLLSLQENPQISAYYATNGQVRPHSVERPFHAQKDMDKLAEELNDTTLFSGVITRLVGASQIQEYYRKATSAPVVQITFDNKVTMPTIAGVDQAYIGLLPSEELLKLLTDEQSGQINEAIFEDNVRAFQGDKSPVNEKMGATLASGNRERFAVMNNGITIVVRDLSIMANQFSLQDYQIVNGGQTSHVLFSHKDRLGGAGVQIPVKLIQTQDEDVIASIVTATNSQTPIKMDQLNSRTEVERNIEKYFAAQEAPKNLLYERRAKQYDSQIGVVKARVIDRYTLVRSVAATFMDEAHLSTGYPQLLMNRIDHSPTSKSQKCDSKLDSRPLLLTDGDEPIVYYAAASAYYRLDLLFKTGKIDSKYKPARWHMLALARKINLQGKEVPSFKNKKFRSWVTEFIDCVWDEHESQVLFQQVASIVEESGLELTRSTFRNSMSRTTLNHVLLRHHQ